MELKDFIKTALSSITNGLIEAQKELEGKNVIINPERVESGKSGDKLLRSDGWRYVQELEFEILVNADEKSSDAGGGKLTVLNIASIGLDSKTEQSVTNSNRLKFKIPVAFPTTRTPDEYKPKGSSFG
jgi:hypothetical protein